jgi:hypothetical protein
VGTGFVQRLIIGNRRDSMTCIARILSPGTAPGATRRRWNTIISLDVTVVSVGFQGLNAMSSRCQLGKPIASLVDKQHPHPPPRLTTPPAMTSNDQLPFSTTYPPDIACFDAGYWYPVLSDKQHGGLFEPPYLTVYCLNPPADICPFGFCPNPDIAGPLVRIASE